jgi:hypothetical protein
VVIIQKTILKTHQVAHVVLFSTDLELPFDKLIEYYKLRGPNRVQFQRRQAELGPGRFHERRANPGDQRSQLIDVDGQPVSTPTRSLPAG